MECVIAIGVLAVLLTGFLAVFTPAAQGIRRSVDAQQADRLASSLERELVTLRTGGATPTITTGFDKAFDWIKNANNSNTAILVYQYRGSTSSMRSDGTPEPLAEIIGQPGEDYVVQTMVRRLDDALFANDITAIEGRIFFVKTKQLLLTSGSFTPPPTSGTLQFIGSAGVPQPANNPDQYPDAVIAFSAEFHSVPNKSLAYLRSPAFQTLFANVKNPVFTRNLAVRR